MDIPVLYSERYVLRGISIEDAEWLYKLLSDSEVIQNLPGLVCFNTCIDSVLNFISILQRNIESNESFVWCIQSSTDNTGIIMINDLSENPYLSYAMLPAYRSQGIMAECLERVCVYLKSYVGKTYTIECNYNNIASKILANRMSKLINVDLILI